MTEWQSMDTAPKDGTMVLLHADWEPVTVVGAWGSGFGDGCQTTDPEGALYDDGLATWRVYWDWTPFSWGFDEPTHWAPLPPDTPTTRQKPASAAHSGTGREG